MSQNLIHRLDFLGNVLDAIPSPVLVVDSDVRILHTNAAATGLVNAPGAEFILKRTGEVLHCLNAFKSPEGCGHSESCHSCVIRNSVGVAMHGGGVTRKKHRMKLVVNKDIRDMHVLVTTAPFQSGTEHYAVLVLEDISELTQLRSLIPICVGCKKIRNDQNYWDSVEEYFERQLDVDFTHALCPDCGKRLYPDVFGKQS